MCLFVLVRLDRLHLGDFGSGEGIGFVGAGAIWEIWDIFVNLCVMLCGYLLYFKCVSADI